MGLGKPPWIEPAPTESLIYEIKAAALLARRRPAQRDAFPDEVLGLIYRWEDAQDAAEQH